MNSDECKRFEAMRAALLNITAHFSPEDIAWMRSRPPGNVSGELSYRDVLMAYDALLLAESPKEYHEQ